MIQFEHRRHGEILTAAPDGRAQVGVIPVDQTSGSISGSKVVGAMAIDTIGAAGQSNLAQLQKQLTQDENSLTTDVKNRAGQQVLLLDQERVALDAASIASAEAQQALQAEQSQQAHAANSNSAQQVDTYL